MTEPCRTKCGKQVTYEKIIFSDGIFFSIPKESDGSVHNCLNIENAEHDLQADAGLIPKLPEPYYHPDNIAKLSPEEKADLSPNVLSYKDRKEYRSHLYGLQVDILNKLEDELGFKEDREEIRTFLGFGLRKIFCNTTMEPAAEPEQVIEPSTDWKKLYIIMRSIGREFTYIEFLGVLYQIDGFYEDAKKCFETLTKNYEKQALEEGGEELALGFDLKTRQREGLGLGNEALIDLMEQKIAQSEVGQDGIKNIGGMWFDESWSDDLLDYLEEVRKNRSQGNDTKSSYQSQKSLTDDQISALKEKEKQMTDAYVYAKILEFEKNDLRPVVRKQFPSEKEMIEKLKKTRWGFGLNKKTRLPSTLYDKAVGIETKSGMLQPEDPLNVGLLRFLDIGNLVQMVQWPAEIHRYLKDIEEMRHKYAHPQKYPEDILRSRKRIVIEEIELCKKYFERLGLK